MTAYCPLPPGPTLALLAARIADELGHLGALSDEVQIALSACGLGTITDRQAATGLQGIDRISQGLTDLARLMAAFGAELAARDGGSEAHLPTAGLAGRVTLYALAQRLFHDGLVPPSVDCPGGAAVVGEVLLF